MQRVAAYRHFEKPTPKGRSSALVAASQPDSWKLRSFEVVEASAIVFHPHLRGGVVMDFDAHRPARRAFCNSSETSVKRSVKAHSAGCAARLPR